MLPKVVKTSKQNKKRTFNNFVTSHIFFFEYYLHID